MTVDGQVAGGSPLLAGLALSAEPELGARLDARGDLDDERLAAVLALDLDRGLAAADGGQERDRQVGLEVAARVAARGRSRPARPPAHPADQLLEDPAAPLLGPPAPPRAAGPAGPKNSLKSNDSNPGPARLRCGPLLRRPASGRRPPSPRSAARP